MDRVRILLTLVFLALLGTSQAQSYDRALGLRGGFGPGVTYKQSLDGLKYAEVLLQGRYQGFGVTALLEWQQELPETTPGLEWFYGFGGHIGGYDRHPGTDDEEGVFVLGADAIIGLEYIFQTAPLSVSLDWKPRFSLIGASRFIGDGGALSIRYVF